MTYKIGTFSLKIDLQKYRSQEPVLLDTIDFMALICYKSKNIISIKWLVYLYVYKAKLKV